MTSPALRDLYSYYPDDGKYLEEEPIVRHRPPPRLLDDTDDDMDGMDDMDGVDGMDGIEDSPPRIAEASPILYYRMAPVAPVAYHNRDRILPQKIIWDQEDPLPSDTHVPTKEAQDPDWSIRIVLLMILLLQVARFF